MQCHFTAIALSFCILHLKLNNALSIRDVISVAWFKLGQTQKVILWTWAQKRTRCRCQGNGLGPQYIADMLTEYKPNRSLRSLGSHQLEIPRVHSKHGESAFNHAASRRDQVCSYSSHIQIQTQNTSV